MLLTEQDAETFRTSSGLSGDVKIIGTNVVNLSRNDTINLWNASDTLVDTLQYGDQDFPGTIRTQGKSGITSFANIGANNVAGWGFSDNGAFWFDGLSVNNITSSFGEIANPGYLNFAAVPEPSAVAMLTLAFGAGALFHLRRRSRRH